MGVNVCSDALKIQCPKSDCGNIENALKVVHLIVDIWLIIESFHFQLPLNKPYLRGGHLSDLAATTWCLRMLMDKDGVFVHREM